MKTKGFEQRIGLVALTQAVAFLNAGDRFWAWRLSREGRWWAAYYALGFFILS
ncbi:hypothetical protein [Ectopseudomonas oleovorans]|uniref:Uncharacterized protein n=1 Tax=Ectopseudomonas oleovorans TaxID=301 RepID=A0AA42GFH6_ECTOL|nr:MULTISPECIES: hypothetical protein [Pseudomonas]MBP8884386.1 hypothetical protein [Pseudomonas sp.]MCR1827893.1 hypothetical protein [Pseudomonas oleovorans]MDG9977548.1 hypothetical protein [Pseudomonas oleovorans]MDH1281877.1 hypothetical protein [Pseudomonas chengduensis]MDH1340295.1 hypothetical protein [Pseudomonas oleovorans]